MTDSIIVREGRLEDLETIVGFNVALAGETEELQLDQQVVRRGVDAVLRDPSKGRYYIAERAGDLAGQLMVTFEWSDWRDGMFLWVQSVYVAPSHRRCGVFTALYRHVQRLASEPGWCGLRLYVHDENTGARETYHRLGLVSPGYVVLESPDHLRDEG